MDMSDGADPLPDGLDTWVEGETGSAVSTARPIGSGASRRIWAVDLVSGEQVIVRFDTGDGPVAGTALDLAREADVYRALAPTAVVIPRLRALHPDGTALLVERAPGADQLQGLPDAEVRSVERDFGRRLGELHQLDPAELDLRSAGCPPEVDPTLHDLELWRGIDAARSGSESSPAVRVALDRLSSTVPGGGRRALCHGDAGPGNFLHGGGRVTALLDWEFAHVGDPHDDLAWVAVRNPLLGRPFDLAATFTSWSATTGSEVELPRLEWFRALVLVRMLISCDASIAWAGPDAPSAQTQAILRPYLGLAVFEALRRAGHPAREASDLEGAARATWEASPIASLLDDPVRLDDLGALL